MHNQLANSSSNQQIPSPTHSYNLRTINGRQRRANTSITPRNRQTSPTIPNQSQPQITNRQLISYIIREAFVNSNQSVSFWRQFIPTSSTRQRSRSSLTPSVRRNISNVINQIVQQYPPPSPRAQYWRAIHTSRRLTAFQTFNLLLSQIYYDNPDSLHPLRQAIRTPHFRNITNLLPNTPTLPAITFEPQTTTASTTLINSSTISIPTPIPIPLSSPSSDSSNSVRLHSPMSQSTPTTTYTNNPSPHVSRRPSFTNIATEEAIRDPPPTIVSPRYTHHHIRVLQDIHQHQIRDIQSNHEAALIQITERHNAELATLTRRLRAARRHNDINRNAQTQMQRMIEEQRQYIRQLNTQIQSLELRNTNAMNRLQSLSLEYAQLQDTTQVLNSTQRRNSFQARQRQEQQQRIHQQTLQTLTNDHQTEIQQLNLRITTLTDQTTQLIEQQQQAQEQIEQQRLARRDRYTQTTDIPRSISLPSTSSVQTIVYPQDTVPISNPITIPDTITISSDNNTPPTIPSRIANISISTPTIQRTQTLPDITMAPINTNSSPPPTLPIPSRQLLTTHDSTTTPISSHDVSQMLDTRMHHFSSQIRQDMRQQITDDLTPMFQAIQAIERRLASHPITIPQPSTPLQPQLNPTSPETSPTSRRAPKPRIDIQQLDEPSNRPFTQDEIDAFLHIPQHRLTETETRTFINRIESHLTHDPNDTEANNEAKALRQVIPHIRWQRLAKWAQVYLNPDVRLSYSRKLYWRKRADEMAVRCYTLPTSNTNDTAFNMRRMVDVLESIAGRLTLPNNAQQNHRQNYTSYANNQTLPTRFTTNNNEYRNTQRYTNTYNRDNNYRNPQTPPTIRNFTPTTPQHRQITDNLPPNTLQAPPTYQTNSSPTNRPTYPTNSQQTNTQPIRTNNQQPASPTNNQANQRTRPYPQRYLNAQLADDHEDEPIEPPGYSLFTYAQYDEPIPQQESQPEQPEDTQDFI